MDVSDVLVQIQDQLVGWVIIFGVIAGIALLAYGFGRCNSCPAANTFESARFKGRFSLMWVPFFIVSVVLLLIGLILIDSESIFVGFLATVSTIVLQVIWACAEVGILHSQVMRHRRTLGMAGVYSQERKRWWMKYFQPGRWVVLRLMLPGAYKRARRIRKEAANIAV